MKIVNSNSGVVAHALLTTGVHGAGSDHLGLFGEASQLLNKVIWKDESEQAFHDANQTTSVDWTDIDLTAYTSANAKLAIIQMLLKLNSYTGSYTSYLFLRKNGTTPAQYSTVRIATSDGDIVGVYKRYTVLIGLDAGQVIEYKIDIIGTCDVKASVNVLGYIE